jgi:hypothetical protein
VRVDQPDQVHADGQIQRGVTGDAFVVDESRKLPTDVFECAAAEQAAIIVCRTKAKLQAWAGYRVFAGGGDKVSVYGQIAVQPRVQIFAR